MQQDVIGAELGRAARRQYRGDVHGGLGRLLFASSPEAFLDELRAQRWMAHALDAQYALARREAAQRARAAAQALRRQRAAERERDMEADRQAQDRNRLRALLARLSLSFGDGAWNGASGFASGLDERPGPAELSAVGFALAQLGSPYVWGGVGPDTYDCSGLTSQAWKAAGVPVPRTSQMQWAGLPRVPAGAPPRPGDLVVYFPDATHVGMYVGQGMVIHAPRPGSIVRLTALHRMPVLGVVRPRTAPDSRPVRARGPEAAGGVFSPSR